MAVAEKRMPRRQTSKEDWLKAGQRMLIEGGIESLKIHDLTATMNVSTGSFYHHFKNFDDYLSALAEFYGSEQAQQVFEKARKKAGNDPKEIIHLGAYVHARGDMRKLYVAMKGWAHGDERAAAAVKRYDQVMMENLDQLFRDIGFDELGAKSRTLIMMGLQSHELDQDGLEPSLQDRWFHIRDLITKV